MIFIATFLKKTKKAMSVGIAFVFLSYFLQIIGGMSDKVKILKQISFFEFTSSRDIILNDNINYTYLIIGTGIILVTSIGTYISYNKKSLV